MLCLLLCTDDCIRGDGDVILGMLLQGEYTEEAVQVSLRRCRRPLSRAERIIQSVIFQVWDDIL